MSILSLQGVSKTYNPGLFKKKVSAVKNLSMEIREGEIFGLIGPNGAGKSSTIRLLLGLSRPDQGRILYRGVPVLESNLRRETGYLPENPYLYDHLSLEEILDFSGLSAGLSVAETRHRSDQMIDRVGLSRARKQRLRTFSKGMLQRAGLCFALVSDPTMLILDEPMSGLDPLGRQMMFELIQELRDKGKTIFFCSHILTDVERLCDRIGIMVNGHMAAELDKHDFTPQQEPMLHLEIRTLDKEQRARLPDKVKVNRRGQGVILSVPADESASFLGSLEALGLRPVGTHTEPFSLEDIFLHAVEANS